MCVEFAEIMDNVVVGVGVVLENGPMLQNNPTGFDIV